MSTREKKCPTCGGPAIDRAGFWETCWNRRPPPCEKSCESRAYQIEIVRQRSVILQSAAHLARMLCVEEVSPDVERQVRDVIARLKKVGLTNFP